MDNLFGIVFFIIALALIFDYTNGFHDAANVVSTVIATRVLAPLTAIILASLLNFLGATQISAVAHTVTSGLIAPASATQIIVLCAIIGAIAWNLVTWYFGVPSSSTYALVGGLIGAAWIDAGETAILWNGLLQKVIIPMILSPIAGFLLGLFVMKTIYFFYRNPKNLKIFAHLQIASASLVALSHGLNDAQKSMGIITLGLFSSGVLSSLSIPFWVIASCAVMMGLGTASGGFRIIRTVGFEITPLKPVQGFAAETSASCVILVASFLGMPVSSTHMIVGSVTGVGAAKGIDNVRWSTGRKLIIHGF
jgi:PiT family inorganic phosphate transporter